MAMVLDKRGLDMLFGKTNIETPFAFKLTPNMKPGHKI